MHKLAFHGKHYEMGWKLGEMFKKEQSYFPIKLNKFQREFGKESGKLLKDYFPEACEEIKGITDAIKHDHELFTSWLLCMGCCLRIREKHNVEVRGCTAFSFVHGNKIYYGRDNDLPPYLKNVSKSICYQPKDKNRFILNTSSFVNGEEGINEYGLVAAMTFVVPVMEEIQPGLNALFLVRCVLEHCKTVKEGINVLKQFPIASSCNILLADKANHMVVAECSPYEINLRKPEINENEDHFIVTVNHFTSEKMSQHDASNKNIYSSKKRFETAYNSLKKMVNHDPVQYAKEILSGKHGFMCQYRKTIKFETIWSSVFNITENRVYRSEGNPMEIEYIEDTRLKSFVDTYE